MVIRRLSIQPAVVTHSLLCVAALVAVYGIFVSAPQRVSIPVTDKTLVDGVWGNDGAGV